VSTATPRGGLQATRPVRHRLSIDRLLPGQVDDLRRAFSAMQRIKRADNRSYLHHAGIHGLPMPFYCKHDSDLFLPWHRAYLYFFELDLRRGVPDVPNFALPWWNWTSGRSHGHGIPAAYADDGGNPLASAEVDPVALQQAADIGLDFPPQTERDPDDPANLPTGERIKQILTLDFLDFSHQLEDVHGEVHGWVGMHMTKIELAAYDPIFWSHHAMIDRLWRLWQVKHPGGRVPSNLLGRALDPFPMTVADTIDMTSLGYDYAATRAIPA
jgi:tyrosinase